jgi:hypothetical protein
MTDKLSIDEWFLHGPDGHSAGRLVRQGEQVWTVAPPPRGAPSTRVIPDPAPEGPGFVVFGGCIRALTALAERQM